MTPPRSLLTLPDPPVPGIEMPLAQPSSPGDVQLNEGNPIVELDGSEVSWGCNGDMVREEISASAQVDQIGSSRSAASSSMDVIEGRKRNT